MTMTNEFAVIFALYPGVTQLDFTGPFEVFARLPGARCTLASVQGGTLQADGGMVFANVARLQSIEHCSLLCVPGGFGSIAAMEDETYLMQLGRLGAQSQYVTSVCTGSLLLAAAGLLRGKKAACHWAWRDLLSIFAVTADPARISRDGKTITGGGVTAGIDLALSVVADIAGERFAQGVQLGLEYAPQPPFECGRPELAHPQIVAAALQRLELLGKDRILAAQRAAQRERARLL
jgi:cyclohexyl-isocyanide hydratase